MEIHFVKKGKQQGTRKITHMNSFIIHILFIILLVRPTTQIWCGHVAHVEKEEMDTIFWSEKLEGIKKQLKIGCVFLYNTKTHFRGTGHVTAY
jgi:hypothetical protein